jgi:teichuronic acid biosynthesis glycosyltransferase TuaC
MHRILTYTTLYPDSIRPAHGIFVENRLRHLIGSHPIESKVVAPVPWFFSNAPCFGNYAVFSRVPKQESRHGIQVEHPRYPIFPKAGMILAPFLLALATKPLVRRIIDNGYDFDILDAHYFYPDGVAAAIIARSVGKPFVVTARGTDLNLIADYRIPRKLIRWTANQASGLITVCQALKDKLVEIGVDQRRITVLRNGVDLNQFKPPEQRETLRHSLGLAGLTILSVGGLVPRKGHDLIIRSMLDLAEISLLIIGKGPDQEKLRGLVKQLQLSDRVRFLGPVEPEQMPGYYGAADMLVLASDREGWANVLLESMACGTPVVATRIWGTPEVVADPSAGILINERTSEAIVQGIQNLLSAMPDHAATRRYAEQFSWDSTSTGIINLFNGISRGKSVSLENLQNPARATGQSPAQ